MENGLNIFRGKEGGTPGPPGDDDKRKKKAGVSSVKRTIAVGGEKQQYEIPLMLKVGKRGNVRPTTGKNVEVIQVTDANGNVYLAGVSK